MMLSLFLFFIKIRSEEPLYNIQIISDPKVILKNQNIIRIPGYQDSTLVCAIPDKVQRKKYDGDPMNIIEKLASQNINIISEGNTFLFYIDGESFVNTTSLGFYSGYEIINQKLYLYTENGGKCNETTHWNMVSEFQCDITEPGFRFDSLYIDGCTVHAIIQYDKLCKYEPFSDEFVMNIKCISEELLESYSHSL